jgi:hypothetical protein
MKHGSQELPDLAIEFLLTTFGHKHDVVVAYPRPAEKDYGPLASWLI